MSNPFKNAQRQVLQVYDILREQGVSYNFIEEFLVPDRIIEVNIPVNMDNGEVKIFTGYRSQHKSILGPYKGGIRFHQDVSSNEVKALSLWMSVKTSVVGLPLGGGKGGIMVNPKELSYNELEQLSRGYVRKLYKYLGEDFDVPAPDVNTNAQIMAWMMDEYSKLVGKYSPGSFTGKPIELGGSKGRNIATSLGGLYVLEKYCDYKKLDLVGKKIAIQGAGNAGLNFAKLVLEKGAKIVSISDSKGAIYDEDGINLEKVEKYKNDKKSVVDIPGYTIISNQDILELDVDVLVLAALENQIKLENVEKIRADILLELANGPIIPEADEILFNNGKIVLPDILANAGGVTVSYFEQVQGNTNFYWTEEEIYTKLKNIMYTATENVLSISDKFNIDYRKASYVISLKRQFDAYNYIK